MLIQDKKEMKIDFKKRRLINLKSCSAKSKETIISQNFLKHMKYFRHSPFLSYLSSLAVRLEYRVSGNFLYEKYKNEIGHVHLIGKLGEGGDC